MQFKKTLLFICCLFFYPILACGQFDTIINVPPDPAPPFIASSNVQLNLFENGILPDSFRVTGGSNLEVNIFGGEVGRSFRAIRSTVNIEGAIFDDFFLAGDDSTVNIAGGTFGIFDASDGSTVIVTGGTIDRFDAQEGSIVDLSLIHI